MPEQLKYGKALKEWKAKAKEAAAAKEAPKPAPEPPKTPAKVDDSLVTSYISEKSVKEE